MNAPTMPFQDSRRRTVSIALLLGGILVMLLSLALSGTASAVPKGNNGTIKIDGVALQGGPANEPHVDCEFALEFSGYDQGALAASVTFALQSPTRRPSGSQVLLTDSIPIGNRCDAIKDRLVVLSVAELLAQAIHRIYHNESVSALFKVAPKDGAR